MSSLTSCFLKAHIFFLPCRLMPCLLSLFGGSVVASSSGIRLLRSTNHYTKVWSPLNYFQMMNNFVKIALLQSNWFFGHCLLIQCTSPTQTQYLHITSSIHFHYSSLQTYTHTNHFNSSYYSFIVFFLCLFPNSEQRTSVFLGLEQIFFWLLHQPSIPKASNSQAFHHEWQPRHPSHLVNEQ